MFTILSYFSPRKIEKCLELSEMARKLIRRIFGASGNINRIFHFFLYLYLYSIKSQQPNIFVFIFGPYWSRQYVQQGYPISKNLGYLQDSLIFLIFFRSKLGHIGIELFQYINRNPLPLSHPL